MLWVVLLTFFVKDVHAATSDDWRSQSIYQIITDRFARTDGSTTYACNNTAQLYCGGTFQGIINQLDYIQDMGFTAVSLSISASPYALRTNDPSLRCVSYDRRDER